MKVKKPKFWESKNNIFSFLLLPLSMFLQFYLKIKRRVITKNSFKIPIICIGNIYIGGTGKTPLSIMLAKDLIERGKKPVIIKKFYSSHFDEHALVKNNGIPLFLNRKRSQAIINAENHGHELAILDDGFQDHSILKDLNILCFNSNQLIGNEMTIPSGPLRENLEAVKRAQIIIINGEKNNFFEEKVCNYSDKIKIYYSQYVPSNLEQFKGKNLYAFAGIGNPNNFFKLLEKHNLKVQKKIEFPDHYEFSKAEIRKMNEECIKNNLELITTEKDYLRIKKYNFTNINHLKIKLEIPKKEELINLILNCK
tara:strand:- start:766 stop:1695 length:930 start_codon:yes stop_codon:yes gene_type:complete